MELFERCAKNKYRWATTIGDLSVEQLFDLPLTSTTNKPSLDSIAVELDSQIKKDTGRTLSFVSNKRATVQEARLKDKFDIVLHIIKYKQEAADIATENASKRHMAERLREELAARKDESIKQLSIEELENKLKELEG